MLKYLRHLTFIGGCMLLLAVTIASCSSAVKKSEPATLGKAIEKVLAHGELKDNSNEMEVTFRSEMFQYCVIVDTKDSTITTARAGLFNTGVECWSVDTRTGELNAFLNKDGMFKRDEWKHWNTEEESITEVNKLRQHFEDAQKDVVKLICEKFGPSPGYFLRGWSIYQSRKGITCGFFC